VHGVQSGLSFVRVLGVGPSWRLGVRQRAAPSQHGYTARPRGGGALTVLCSFSETLPLLTPPEEAYGEPGAGVHVCACVCEGVVCGPWLNVRLSLSPERDVNHTVPTRYD
jgi:hypothetical protein